MIVEDLKERVCKANQEIQRVRLAILTWGNASEVDREAGVFAIKPSGVPVDHMTAWDIPLVSLETGQVVEGDLKPSSDTATHWHLYRSFPDIGGVVHTHSPTATAWAQAEREIPCLGTTHADTFYGPVPCTRPLTREEVDGAYELNTGKVITEHFEAAGVEPMECPGVLVSRHGPFTWGASAAEAVTHSRILEEVARIAATTLTLNPASGPVDPYLLDRHYLRKHGEHATYGQVRETGRPSR